MSEPVGMLPPLHAPDDTEGERGVVRDNTEAVHTYLRRAILRCELPENVPLSQVQLAERLGVSRTPLREALRMLQREGLIEGVHNQRVRVAGFSIGDLEQVYAARIMLESLAIRVTVPRLGEDDLRTLAAYLAEMDTLARVEDYERWNAVHRRFHAGLVAHGGERLLGEIGQLSDHAERYRYYYTTRSPGAWIAGAAEHRAILAACQDRSPADAAGQLARHYSTVALRVIAMVEPEHDPAILRTALRAVISSGSS
jgi:DNA-binding GntR family transcriptional regulator